MFRLIHINNNYKIVWLQLVTQISDAKMDYNESKNNVYAVSIFFIFFLKHGSSPVFKKFIYTVERYKQKKSRIEKKRKRKWRNEKRNKKKKEVNKKKERSE